MIKRWYRLDNAAKIFPSVSNKKRTNVFRLSYILKEEVEPSLLLEALRTTIDRFHSFKVKLKKGIFWYYLEENNELPNIFPESPYVCQRFDRKDNNGYLFKVYYFQKRITIEIFHSLTDGGGAMELSKAIVYKYLKLKGYNVESENMVLTDVENVIEEDQDSYLKNYDPKIKTNPREKRAIQIKGTRYEVHWLSLIIGTVEVSKVKELCKVYNCSITEFLTSCLIMSSVRVPHLFEHNQRPYQIFIPVNLRTFFPSKTMRNFSLYIATSINLREDLKFEEIVQTVKTDFKNELVKEKFIARIAANVTIEKNFFMRIVPLFLKELILRLGYNAWGDSNNTQTISNIGKVQIPKSMEPYIDNIIFANGASYTSPVNIASGYYMNKLSISFSSRLIERDMQREFFRILAEFGLDVLIETNELEVQDEKMFKM